VRVEVDIILEGVSVITIYDYTRYKIIILISGGAYRRERADIMTLLSNDNGELNL